jgi:hypothetical protein
MQGCKSVYMPRYINIDIMHGGQGTMTIAAAEVRGSRCTHEIDYQATIVYHTMTLISNYL